MIENERDLAKAVSSIGYLGIGSTFNKTEAKAIFRSVNQLHLNCLNIVPVEVPIVAADAIEIAHDYWLGQSVDEFKLESSRGTCYDFLKSRGVFVQPIEKNILQ